MEPPAITRHRRPFLAPLWLSLLAALLVGAAAWTFYRTATTTVVMLVRPVERPPGTIADPPLSPEGEERAQHLAEMFGAAGGSGRVDAIYVSADRRAQQTAAPLAERVHQTPIVFTATDARATAARLLHEHPGGTVLVIGSGATLPEMIRELAGSEAAPVTTEEADPLYLISVPTFGHPHLMRLRV